MNRAIANSSAQALLICYHNPVGEIDVLFFLDSKSVEKLRQQWTYQIPPERKLNIHFPMIQLIRQKGTMEHLRLRCMVNFYLCISILKGKPCKVFQGLNSLKGFVLVLMKNIFQIDMSHIVPYLNKMNMMNQAMTILSGSTMKEVHLMHYCR